MIGKTNAGGGSQKVFIDGVRYKENLNLTSRTFAENIQISTLPQDCYQGGAVIYHDELHLIFRKSTEYCYHYKFDGTAWTKVSDLPFSFTSALVVVIEIGRAHV